MKGNAVVWTAAAGTTLFLLAIAALPDGGGGGGGLRTEALPPRGILVPARRTSMSAAEVYPLITAEYQRRFGQRLSRSQALVILAQWAIETTYGKNLWNFNFGNVKPTRAWTGTFVVLTTTEVHRRDGKLVRERWRAPFIAYPTPSAGLKDWMRVLFGSRHGGSRAFVLKADPIGFGRALGNRADGGSGYATARADDYGKAVSAAYRRLNSAV